MSGADGRMPRSGQRRLLALCAGFVTWFFVLCVVYALHAWGCAMGWSGGVLRATLAVLVLLVAGGLAAWILRRADALQDVADFLPRAIRLATWAALAATVLSLLPPLLLTPCT